MLSRSCNFPGLVTWALGLGSRSENMTQSSLTSKLNSLLTPRLHCSPPSWIHCSPPGWTHCSPPGWTRCWCNAHWAQSIWPWTSCLKWLRCPSCGSGAAAAPAHSWTCCPHLWDERAETAQRQAKVHCSGNTQQINCSQNTWNSTEWSGNDSASNVPWYLIMRG